MSRLFERINERSQVLKEDYDFTRDMSTLFSQKFQGVRDIPELPVEPNKMEWEENSSFEKTSLNRRFSFQNHRHLRFFVEEILKESDRMMHHPTMVVGSDYVEIELYTHDINDISEQDLTLSKFINDIYEDVKFIQEF